MSDTVAKTGQVQQTPVETGTASLVVRKREVGGIVIPELITDAKDYNEAVGQWRANPKFNLLTPVVNISNVPAWHSVVFAQVTLHPNPDLKDVYRNPLFCKSHEVAIAGVGLAKLALAASMETWAVRVDSGTVEHFYEYEGHAKFLGFDGTPIHIARRKTWDLRDGSLQLKGFKGAQIEEARKHGAANGESRAINRAIRQYGIKQVYQQSEIANPFIVAKLTFTPPLEDPDVKKFYMAMKLGKESLLFGGPPSVAAPQLPAGADPQKLLPPEQRQAVTVSSTDPDDDAIASVDEPELVEPKQKSQAVTYRPTGVFKGSRSGKYWLTVAEFGDRPLYLPSAEAAEFVRDIKAAGHLLVLEMEKHGDETHVSEWSDGGAA